MQKRLDSNDEVNFKIYYDTTWLTNDYMHILLNIARSKHSQAMKFGQLKEYNKICIFL